MQYFVIAIILINVIGAIASACDKASKRQQRNIAEGIRQAQTRKDYWS